GLFVGAHFIPSHMPRPPTWRFLLIASLNALVFTLPAAWFWPAFIAVTAFHHFFNLATLPADNQYKLRGCIGSITAFFSRLLAKAPWIITVGVAIYFLVTTALSTVLVKKILIQDHLHPLGYIITLFIVCNAISFVVKMWQEGFSFRDFAVKMYRFAVKVYRDGFYFGYVTIKNRIAKFLRQGPLTDREEEVYSSVLTRKDRTLFSLNALQGQTFGTLLFITAMSTALSAEVHSMFFTFRTVVALALGDRILGHIFNIKAERVSWKKNAVGMLMVFLGQIALILLTSSATGGTSTWLGIIVSFVQVILAAGQFILQRYILKVRHGDKPEHQPVLRMIMVKYGYIQGLALCTTLFVLWAVFSCSFFPGPGHIAAALFSHGFLDFIQMNWWIPVLSVIYFANWHITYYLQSHARILTAAFVPALVPTMTWLIATLWFGQSLTPEQMIAGIVVLAGAPYIGIVNLPREDGTDGQTGRAETPCTVWWGQFVNLRTWLEVICIQSKARLFNPIRQSEVLLAAYSPREIIFGLHKWVVVSALGNQVHYGIPFLGREYFDSTYAWAIEAGFGPREAAIIAASDTDVDSLRVVFSTLMPSLTKWLFSDRDRGLHFKLAGRGGADTRVEALEREFATALRLARETNDPFHPRALMALGRCLHSLQDKVAHGDEEYTGAHGLEGDATIVDGVNDKGELVFGNKRLTKVKRLTIERLTLYLNSTNQYSPGGCTRSVNLPKDNGTAPKTARAEDGAVSISQTTRSKTRTIFKVLALLAGVVVGVFSIGVWVFNQAWNLPLSWKERENEVEVGAPLEPRSASKTERAFVENESAEEIWLKTQYTLLSQELKDRRSEWKEFLNNVGKMKSEGKEVDVETGAQILGFIKKTQAIEIEMKKLKDRLQEIDRQKQQRLLVASLGARKINSEGNLSYRQWGGSAMLVTAVVAGLVVYAWMTKDASGSAVYAGALLPVGLGEAVAVVVSRVRKAFTGRSRSTEATGAPQIVTAQTCEIKISDFRYTCVKDFVSYLRRTRFPNVEMLKFIPRNGKIEVSAISCEKSGRSKEEKVFDIFLDKQGLPLGVTVDKSAARPTISLLSVYLTQGNPMEFTMTVAAESQLYPFLHFSPFVRLFLKDQGLELKDVLVRYYTGMAAPHRVEILNRANQAMLLSFELDKRGWPKGYDEKNIRPIVLLQRLVYQDRLQPETVRRGQNHMKFAGLQFRPLERVFEYFDRLGQGKAQDVTVEKKEDRIEFRAAFKTSGKEPVERSIILSLNADGQPVSAVKPYPTLCNPVAEMHKQGHLDEAVYAGMKMRAQGRSRSKEDLLRIVYARAKVKFDPANPEKDLARVMAHPENAANKFQKKGLWPAYLGIRARGLFVKRKPGPVGKYSKPGARERELALRLKANGGDEQCNSVTWLKRPKKVDHKGRVDRRGGDWQLYLSCRRDPNQEHIELPQYRRPRAEKTPAADRAPPVRKPVEPSMAVKTSKPVIKEVPALKESPLATAIREIRSVQIPTEKEAEQLLRVGNREALIPRLRPLILDVLEKDYRCEINPDGRQAGLIDRAISLGDEAICKAVPNQYPHLDEPFLVFVRKMIRKGLTKAFPSSEIAKQEKAAERQRQREAKEQTKKEEQDRKAQERKQAREQVRQQRELARQARRQAAREAVTRQKEEAKQRKLAEKAAADTAAKEARAKVAAAQPAVNVSPDQGCKGVKELPDFGLNSEAWKRVKYLLFGAVVPLKMEAGHLVFWTAGLWLAAAAVGLYLAWTYRQEIVAFFRNQYGPGGCIGSVAAGQAHENQSTENAAISAQAELFEFNGIHQGRVAHPFEHILFSCLPVDGKTSEEQAYNVFTNIDRALAQNGCDKRSVVKQVLFVRNEDDKKTCQEVMAFRYGRSPPATSYVFQTPANGTALAVEVMAVPASTGATITRPDEHLTVVEYDRVRWAFVAGLQPRPGIQYAKEQATDCFTQMKALLEKNGFRFEHVVRPWIYQGDITGKEERDGVAGQKYDGLNAARKEFFQGISFGGRFLKAPLPNGLRPYPASTGISMNSGTIVMECLAFATDRDDVEIRYLENPLQTPVQNYKAGVLHGKKVQPLFARAVAVRVGGQWMVLVSGTASIRGDDTVGKDIREQTEMAIENVAAVLNEGGARPSDLAQVRVYVKFEKDYPAVKKIVEERLPGVPCILVIAGVCRSDLLIELEGVAYTEKPVRTPAPGRATKMIGWLGSNSLSALEHMMGLNTRGYPEEDRKSFQEMIERKFGGTMKKAPELYAPEFDALLDQKTSCSIPDDIMARLNSLKPYKDGGYENERSAEYAQGYARDAVAAKTLFAFEKLRLKGGHAFYAFARFPAIYYGDFDNLFGFNSAGDEDLKESPMSAQIIGLCNELIGNLQFLDQKNRAEGKPTNRYLEALTHEALHLCFTHEEARVLARYLFPENYPDEKEIEAKGGLLNIALTNLVNIEKTIAYLARPERMKWPFDRHNAFREIAELIVSSDLTYPPLFKKMTRAILIFSFFPEHPDLSVSSGSIAGWLYHIGATDDLALAVLWALETPSQLQDVTQTAPYLDQVERRHFSYERLLGRRAENRPEDRERFFTTEEKIEIISYVIRYAGDRGWDNYERQYVGMVFKILPFLPEFAKADVTPIFVESATVLQDLLYPKNGIIYAYSVEKAEVVLSSLLRFIKKFAITKFPDEFTAVLDRVNRDSRDILTPIKEETRALVDLAFLSRSGVRVPGLETRPELIEAYQGREPLRVVGPVYATGSEDAGAQAALPERSSAEVLFVVNYSEHLCEAGIPTPLLRAALRTLAGLDDDQTVEFSRRSGIEDIRNNPAGFSEWLKRLLADYAALGISSVEQEEWLTAGFLTPQERIAKALGQGTAINVEAFKKRAESRGCNIKDLSAKRLPCDKRIREIAGHDKSRVSRLLTGLEYDVVMAIPVGDPERGSGLRLLGLKLKVQRIVEGKSMDEVAAALGLSSAGPLSTWENGQNFPDNCYWPRLLQSLNISAGKLIYGKTDKEIMRMPMGDDQAGRATLRAKVLIKLLNQEKTVEQFARGRDIPQGIIYDRLEGAFFPSAQNFVKLAAAMEITPADLWAGVTYEELRARLVVNRREAVEKADMLW
ncbi:MAG: hypothetical protein HQL18_03120, partial [Candidatus Omnitrophica bacterium]|nr:hypothetical protein [Candidatus Omnitrophota bacterium]